MKNRNNMLNNEKGYKYWFMEWIEKDEYAFFSMINSDIFYMYNKNTKEVVEIGRSNECLPSIQMFRGGVWVGNKIYFAPRMSRKMAIFDLEKNSFQYVNIFDDYNNPYDYYFEPSLQGFMSIKDDEGNGWLIYGNSPVCIRIDAKTQELLYITSEERLDQYLIGTDYVLEENILYAPLIGKNGLIRLKMKEKKIDYISIGNTDERFYSITNSEKGKCYLLSYDKPSIILWDSYLNLFHRIIDLPVEWIKYEQSLIIRKNGDVLRVFPGFDIYGGNGNVFSYNISTGELKEEYVFLQYKDYKKWPMQSIGTKLYFFVCKSDENPFLSRNGIYIFYDWGKNTIEEVSLPLPNGETEFSISEIIDKHEVVEELNYYNNVNGFLYEGEYLNIAQFIRALSE